MSDAAPRRDWSERLTFGVLVLIVLLIGIMAGAASFSHVHDFTLDNSPEDTPDWFGWGNAVITELVPVASLIYIARRRRTGGSIGYAVFLILLFMGVSLTAQLAVAVPSIFGWLVSALPAVAFFLLSKLVFSASKPNKTTQKPDLAATASAATAPIPTTPIAQTTSSTQPARVVIDQVPAPAAVQQPATGTPRDVVEPAPVAPAITAPAAAAASPRAQAQVASASDTITEQAIPTTHRHMNVPTAPEQAPAPSAPDFPVTAPDAAQPTKLPAPAALLTRARHIAAAHLEATGELITRGALARRLQVGTDTADQLLALLDLDPARSQQPVAAANGNRVDLTA
ncbi:hypothetical protein ACPPVO_52000 [Dactylosporangium sp. McL0621]|uniref:hypothetical protein n=1 Tax=Dactylosporangium sp. McL0621 TaxID=3415678 RepID=UPI003CF8B393